MKASWMLQDQLERSSSVNVASAGEVDTMWTSLKQDTPRIVKLPK